MRAHQETARHCGACMVRLQRLEPSSAWMELARLQLEAAGLDLAPDSLGVALVVHTAIVHPELTTLPPLVDDKGRGDTR